MNLRTSTMASIHCGGSPAAVNAVLAPLQSRVARRCTQAM